MTRIKARAHPDHQSLFWAVLPLLALMILLAPAAARANSGADTTILNVVTVDYKDATGTQSFSATASSTVTVNLVEAALTISGRPTGVNPGDTAAQPSNASVASGATQSYLLALTANANGDDIYDLFVTKGAVSNVTGDTVSHWLVEPDGTTVSVVSPATVTLGASVITAVTAADTLEFPGGTLTNIAAGDIVVISGVDYEVSAVTVGSGASHDNGGGSPHSDVGATTAEVKGSLTLIANINGSNTAPAFGAPQIGQLAREQVLLKVDVSATATGGSDGTVPFTAATDSDQEGTLNGGNQASTTKTTTFTGVQLTIQKEVRNVTQSGSFGASTSGDTLDILEYRVTIDNTGSGNATEVVVTDAVPTYTTLVTFTNAEGYGAASPTGIGNPTDFFAQGYDGTTTVDLTMQNSDTENGGVASGDGAGTTAGSALTINVGTGNNNTTGGTVDTVTTYTILYQVKID